VHGAPPYKGEHKGEHAGQRTDYFRARSVLYLRVSNSYLGPGFNRLPNHTQPSLPSTLLPAPQSQARSEEENVVQRLTPRLERHVSRGYVHGAPVVLTHRGRAGLLNEEQA
jgi:hypothetical protein